MDILRLEIVIILIVAALSDHVKVYGLQCWHCIADDCADDPTDNYKASKKSCLQGHTCQKVYFEMVEETDRGNFVHTSTVRGCSAICETRNDFQNCTHQQRTSRGCVRKDCCSDGDLCNHASRVHCHVLQSVIVPVCLSCVFLIKWIQSTIQR